MGLVLGRGMVMFPGPSMEELEATAELLFIKKPWTTISAINDAVVGTQAKLLAADTEKKAEAAAEELALYSLVYATVAGVLLHGTKDSGTLSEVGEADMIAALAWAANKQGIDTVSSTEELISVTLPKVTRFRAAETGRVLLTTYPKAFLTALARARVAEKNGVDGTVGTAAETKDLETEVVYSLLGYSTFEIPADVTFHELLGMVHHWGATQQAHATGLLAIKVDHKGDE